MINVYTSIEKAFHNTIDHALGGIGSARSSLVHPKSFECHEFYISGVDSCLNETINQIKHGEDPCCAERVKDLINSRNGDCAIDTNTVMSFTVHSNANTIAFLRGSLKWGGP